MAKKPQIPLNELLGNLDRSNFNYYSGLDEDLKKAFSPFVVMRYATNTANKELYSHYLTMVNALCNVNFSTLSKHPELFWKLLCVAGVGENQFHKWLPPGKKAKKSKVQEFLAQMYPTYKLEDLEMLEQVNTKEQLKEMAKIYGYEDKEIKEMFK